VAFLIFLYLLIHPPMTEKRLGAILTKTTFLINYLILVCARSDEKGLS
jgi:hypothetical protein